ncbi:MAG TPA: hypothetical protein VHP32_05060 [Ignavibacteria bacterium]|nr:hypothetical protein [Ignavibacteria bacterium]
MKFLIFTIIFFAILFSSKGYCQYDRHGNPIFNSVILSEDEVDDFEIDCGYYTIDDNIANDESSVYMNDNPTKEDYIKFARSLPSYFFIIHENRNVQFMIMPIIKVEDGKTKYFYNVIFPGSKKNALFPCTVTGAISEKRAEELVRLKVDSKAKIYFENGIKLFEFQNAKYKVQNYKELKSEVTGLSKDLMSIKSLSLGDIETYIKKESIGGRLDFVKTLEADKLYLVNGVAVGPAHYSIFLWGLAVAKLGIEDYEEALELYEEIYKTDLRPELESLLLAGFKSVEKE